MTSVSFQRWHLDLIGDARTARLATVTPAGAPHLVPVCFAFCEGRFAIPIDEKPKATTRLARLANIAHDARVSLLFDRYDEDWTKLAWVRVDGEATVLPVGEASPASLAALRHRYGQYGTMDLESRPLILVAPAVVAAWRWTAG